MDDHRDIFLARQGDQAAFARLCDRHSGLLYFHGVEPHFAPGLTSDDLWQEARIGLWKAVRDFRPDGGARFRHFASVCVRRNVASAVSTAKRQKQEMLNNAVFLGAAGEDGEPFDPPDFADPAAVFAGREALREALARLEVLSPLERECYVRVAVNGESYAAISVEIGVSAKTIDNALQRAREKMAGDPTEVEKVTVLCLLCERPSTERTCAGCVAQVAAAKRLMEAA